MTRILVKTGEGAPGENDLVPGEFAWDEVEGTLYGKTSGDAIVSINSDRRTADLVEADVDDNFPIRREDGIWHRIIFTSGCTLLFEFPAGVVESMLLELENAGNYDVVFTDVQWAGGTVPAFSSSGVDHVVVYCDASGNIYGGVVGLDIS